MLPCLCSLGLSNKPSGLIALCPFYWWEDRGRDGWVACPGHQLRVAEPGFEPRVFPSRARQGLCRWLRNNLSGWRRPGCTDTQQLDWHQHDQGACLAGRRTEGTAGVGEGGLVDRQLGDGQPEPVTEDSTPERQNGLHQPEVQSWLLRGMSGGSRARSLVAVLQTSARMSKRGQTALRWRESYVPATTQLQLREHRPNGARPSNRSGKMRSPEF